VIEGEEDSPGRERATRRGEVPEILPEKLGTDLAGGINAICVRGTR